ncbi:hypothetical protein ABT294_00085 [Nonomuraea sp. NPDC000554]|uniref:hypothetical protein n=1 Tax=Nonomuraea sp. NPDC000554 TaxID=3154259 RepID=UPI00331BB69B
MVTSQHEALHRIFQEDTSLLARTFERLELPFPEPLQVSVLNPELTEIAPIERRVDTLLKLETKLGDHLLVIESQSRRDDRKTGSWAYYLSYLHEKYKCPVTLLVICQDAVTASWARLPKRIGLAEWPSLVLYTIALGPDNVPAIIEKAEASADVVLTVFSALIHGRSPKAGDILEVLATALDTIDTDTAGFFTEFTEVGLGNTAARKLWRGLMSTKTYRYQSEYAQQLRAEGEAASVLRVLERRGVPIDNSVRERIMSCSDTELLFTWLDRAIIVQSADKLFD